MGCLVNKDLLPGIIADSTLMKYAVEELKALGYTSASDGIDGMLYNDVIELLAVFVSQGHSNNSAHTILNMFQRLALFKPLSPLRFTDDEWVEFADGKYQNTRCSCFFKESPHVDRIFTIEGYTKCSSRRREYGSSEITDGTGLCWSGCCFHVMHDGVVLSEAYTQRCYLPESSYADGFNPYDCISLPCTEVEILPDDWEFFVEDTCPELQLLKTRYELQPMRPDVSFVGKHILQL